MKSSLSDHLGLHRFWMRDLHDANHDAERHAGSCHEDSPKLS